MSGKEMTIMTILAMSRALAVAALLVAPSVPLAEAGAPAPAPASSGPHRPEHQIVTLREFRFESGDVLRDIKISYVTHGVLSPRKDNAILVMQHFFGDHHDFDFLIGPGKPLDTSKYFIVAPDFLGNSHLRDTLTTGPTNSGLKMAFPRYTIRDSANLDYRFVKEALGIERVLAAIGSSMGAMKAYQLAVSHPDFTRAIIPIAGSPATHPHTKWILRHAMSIIELDGGWYGGSYEVNPVAGVTRAFFGLVPWWYTTRWFGTNLKTEEQFREWDRRFRELFVRQIPQDTRDIYYQLHAWAEFDIGQTPGFKGDTRAALAAIKARTLLIGIKDDLLVRREELEAARGAIPGATLFELESLFGHAAVVGFDPDAIQVMGREITKFLAGLR
jgi:homoserine O-acetyltransferase